MTSDNGEGTRHLLTDDEERETLLVIYVLERQDAGSLNAIYLGLLSAALALIGVAAIAFVSGAPGWMFAFLPLLPMPIFGVTGLFMMPSGLRNQYVKSLEHRLDELLEVTTTIRVREKTYDFQIPSNHRLGDRVFKKPPGLFSVVGLVGVIGLIGGLVGAYLVLTAAAALYATNRGWAGAGIPVAVICVPAAALLAWACADSWRDAGVLTRSELERIKGEGEVKASELPPPVAE